MKKITMVLLLVMSLATSSIHAVETNNNASKSTPLKASDIAAINAGLKNDFWCMAGWGITVLGALHGNAGVAFAGMNIAAATCQ